MTDRAPEGSLKLRGLYAILDVDTLQARDIGVIDAAQALLAARPCALQLRAKHASARDSLALLEALVPLCRGAGVPLFMNDRPDLALLADVDGVHLGQDDLPLSELRRLCELTGKRLWVGISTHDAEQLELVLAQRPDYVAFGPLFPTQSKQNPDPVVGLPRLEAMHAKCLAAGVPLVGIGGIDLERAADLACRAEAGAVIGQLFAAGLGGVTERARDLHQRLGG
ncbi:MAG: thiamine phosphate synthase [Polyangiaceae bacterium]|nr:thiamine phosphate synthase [Myxococcales bacterium]MCB9588815.1 thiamine phosphate synthase [Polyangiaceae bacterium]MCB9605374.1 thiamine phosphate synthase [Polyangiaceae bacterium]